MAYSVDFKSTVYKDIAKLPTKTASKIMDLIEQEITITPDRYPILWGKHARMRKYCHGSYSIIYTILESSTLILRVGHRKDIYK